MKKYVEFSLEINLLRRYVSLHTNITTPGQG